MTDAKVQVDVIATHDGRVVLEIDDLARADLVIRLEFSATAAETLARAILDVVRVAVADPARN
jgi:glutathione synthase/RimK-type ligase-like ATP-grasp enzyme